MRCATLRQWLCAVAFAPVAAATGCATTFTGSPANDSPAASVPAPPALRGLPGAAVPPTALRLSGQTAPAEPGSLAAAVGGPLSAEGGATRDDRKDSGPANGVAAPDPTRMQPAAAVNSALASPTEPAALQIDLPMALEMVHGQNPQVMYARERIQEAYARLEGAQALWLPSIRVGANWNKHEGRIQDVAGQVFEASRGSYFTGLGADGVGAGSPRVPGMLMAFHLADAMFQPRIEQRAAGALQWAAVAATNDAMLKAALAYIELQGACQEVAIAQEAVDSTRELARLTGDYAASGQGVAADDDRARAELAMRENDVRRATEAVGVIAARLAAHLRWDPTIPIQPREPQVTPIELGAAQQSTAALVAHGLLNRPEVSEHKYLASEAAARLKRAEYGPLVPSLLLGLSYGGLGGGFGSSFGDFGDRLDVDAVVWWEIRNLGRGDRAARCQARSRLNQAHWRTAAVLDSVAAEIVVARSQVESRAAQRVAAEDALQHAQRSLSRNLERIRNAQGLPLEALQSIQALAQARREYSRAVLSYNEAQFRLHHALGWPAESLESRSPDAPRQPPS